MARNQHWLASLAVVIGQLACHASPPASQAAQADVTSLQSPAPRKTTASTTATQRYDLERDERSGGHTLARHVGQSDAALSDRLRREPRISAASTYTDRVTAERVVAKALDQYRRRIDQWLERQGPRPNLALNYRGASSEPIGRSLARRGRQPVACTSAVVVLRWDGRDGFYVLTSYPEAAR